jgi:hypothetical protein
MRSSAPLNPKFAIGLAARLCELRVRDTRNAAPLARMGPCYRCASGGEGYAGETFDLSVALSSRQLSSLNGNREPDMIPRIPESVFRFGWMVDDSLAAVMGDAMPPRDPSDDDDEEDENEDDEPDDEPAVIREPDE